MSRINANYQLLHAIRTDLMEIQRNSPGLSFLLRQRMNEFFQRNSIRINMLDKNHQQLVQKYVLKDENGNPQTEEVNGVQQYKFENELEKTAFTKEMTEFMMINIEVEA